MTEFILCADFSMFPDQHLFNPTFLLAGYSFVQLSNWSTPEMTVQQTTYNELGLQFPQAGVEITLPTPVTRVNFRVANGNQPINVDCFDASGNITEDKNIDSTSRFVDFQIAASTISVLKITGGNNDTRISRICIAVCVT